MKPPELLKVSKCSLKVSKSQKQNTKFSHTPKNQQNFVHSFALASKSGWIKKKKLSIVLNSPKLLIQIIKYLYVQNFVGFLEYGRNWYFAFEIYWPLEKWPDRKLVNPTYVQWMILRCFLLIIGTFLTSWAPNFINYKSVKCFFFWKGLNSWFFGLNIFLVVMINWTI